MTNKKINDILSLIKHDRLRKSTNRGILIESESDKGRIVNSPAFRRLQQKAQVFPLEPNAAVRTRLTHSIEVSQVGRHLAQKVIEVCKGSGENYSLLSAFVNTVESACLIHDIGNPPFGHFGEAAIQDWFADIDSPEPDLLEFDGNPQGFRIISRLSGYDSYGLNLTATLLASSIKYPWMPANKPESKKKIGIFSTEWDKYEEACNLIGWQTGKPFPIMRLMDTADEIAYSLSDIEDGIEKRIVTYADLRENLDPEIFKNKTQSELIAYKTKIINSAVETAARNFCEHLDQILNGDEVDLLPDDSEPKNALNKIKIFVRRDIYTHKAAEQIELAGYSVVRGLLDSYKSFVSNSSQAISKNELEILIHEKSSKKIPKRPGLDKDSRLVNMLPSTYKEKYLEDIHSSEMAKRAHLIVDFVSGMTDDYALDTFQILQGIKIR
jgi:dGTPase